LKTADEQLSFDTDGGRTQVLIEDVEVVVRERAADDTGEGDIRDTSVNAGS